MYSKIISTIIGVCAFFGMIIVASIVLKDAGIELTTPETAANHKPVTITPDERNITADVNATALTDNGEPPVFYDVDSPAKPAEKQTLPTDQATDTPAKPSPATVKTGDKTEPKQSTAGSPQIDPAYIDILLQAETNAPNNGAKRILQTARKMALTDKAIIQGSCWDYINEVYNQSGFPQTKRRQLFNGEYKAGPYADQNLFKPADWLYFVNHSYKDVEHSSLFIGWTNRQKNEALMLTYGGENRKEPARYRVYDLSHVYGIVRPSSQPVKPLR